LGNAPYGNHTVDHSAADAPKAEGQKQKRNQTQPSGQTLKGSLEGVNGSLLPILS